MVWVIVYLILILIYLGVIVQIIWYTVKNSKRIMENRIVYYSILSIAILLWPIMVMVYFAVQLSKIYKIKKERYKKLDKKMLKLKKQLLKGIK